MAESSWPYDSSAIDDIQYEALVGNIYPDGMLGRPTDPQMCYGDSSGMRVSFQANSMVLVRGRVWSSGATVITRTIDANTSGQTRYDLVVIRLDRTSFQATAVVRKGTPGAGVPSFTQTVGTTGYWEVPIAKVQVASGAITIGGSDVTVAGWYAAPGGGAVLCTSATRPPHVEGLRIHEHDTGVEYVSNGSSWRISMEDTDWQGLTVTSAWSWGSSGTDQPLVRRKDGVVYFRTGEIARTSNLASGSDSQLFDIPPGFRAPQIHKAVGVYGSRPANVTFYYSTSPSRANQVWVINQSGMSTGDILHLPDVSWPLALS